MKLSTGLSVFVALSLPLSALATEYQFAIKYDPDAVDTSEWECEYCEYPEGYTGELELGVGAVSDDAFKFGEYNGLNEEGAYLIGNARVIYRGQEDARYYDLNAHDLGLDTRSLSLEGGRQGHYDVFLNYDELPHFISGSAQTPFRGMGNASLGLPAGWVDSGSTAGMSALAAGLRGVDLETKRKRLGIGAHVLQGPRWGPHWEYKASLRREDRDGALRAGGAFFFTAAQLIRPVDYETDEVDASIAYNSRKLQVQLAYYGSTFRNADESLTWDNPFTALIDGADRGQLAAPPDNQFHQASASVGYQWSERTRATADVAFGRMTQDERFLPATLNAALGPVSLPRSSLDGEVDTLTANLRLSSAVTEKLDLNASYSYNDRDNQTPQAAYTWVTTDSFLNGPVTGLGTRTNLPYSYTRDTVKLGADYSLPKGSRLRAGYEYDAYKRNFQEVNKTEEDSLWAKLKWRIDYKTHLRFKYTHAERDVSGYSVVPEIGPPENPLLRKYNMADRIRDLVGVNASLTPTRKISLGAGVDYINDDYENSDVGLVHGRELNLSADASLAVNEKTSVSLYINRERIESLQKGSQTYSTADWAAENDDTVTTAGLGVKYQAIEDKLDIGADYMHSRSRGEIRVSGSEYPDLETKRDTFKLYATYRLKEDMSLHAAYWHERYDSDDWSLNGVVPDTVGNVLSLGEDSHSYNVNALGLSVHYNF
jgi:MtrB/PioB family decaheme-associated outer membrane protein